MGAGAYQFWRAPRGRPRPPTASTSDPRPSIAPVAIGLVPDSLSAKDIGLLFYDSIETKSQILVSCLGRKTWADPEPEEPTEQAG